MTLILGCECVTNLDTPKIISPDDYSEVIIINAIPDRESLQIESNDIPLLNKADYSNPYPNYRKINSGASFLRLMDDVSKLYLVNMPIELNKFGNYTILFYGYRNSVKPLIIEDSLRKFQKSANSFYRFVHISFDTQILEFKIKSSTESKYELNFRSFTELKEILPGKYDIEVYNPINNKLVANFKDFQANSKFLYNFVLKGTSLTSPSKPLTLDIISTPIED
jgi:hypothetical protein